MNHRRKGNTQTMDKMGVSGQSESKLWEFYEELNEIVYVADTENHELVYMNRRAQFVIVRS